MSRRGRPSVRGRCGCGSSVRRSMMPLTDAQRRHLERRLQEERARLLRDLDRSLAVQEQEDEQDRAGDLTKYPFHPADLGTDTMDTEVEVSNETRMSGELAEIDAALDRLY